MLSIMNGFVVQVSYNPGDEDEYKRNGETHVPIKGHEKAEAFIEALEVLNTDAAVKIEELLQTVYELGIEQGKKMERAEHPITQTHPPTISLRMRR